MKLDNSSRCIYCGSAQHIGEDYIPPKNLFLDKKNLGLITVPACPRCKKINEKNEECLRIFISSDVTRQKRAARGRFGQPVGVSQGRQKMLNAMAPVERVIFIEKKDGSAVLKMDLSKIVRVIERIVKGLYWHHYGECLSGAISFNIYLKPPVAGVIKDVLLSKTRLHGIGKGEFRYRFKRSDTDKCQSAWGLSFFKSVHFLVTTKKKK